MNLLTRRRLMMIQSGISPVNKLPWNAMTHPSNNRASKYLSVPIKEGDIVKVGLSDYSMWRFAILVLTENVWGQGTVISDSGWQTANYTKIVNAAETGYYLRITISRIDNSDFTLAAAEAALSQALAIRPESTMELLQWDSAVVDPNTRYYRFVSVPVQLGDEITIRLNDYTNYQVGCAITQEKSRNSIFISDTGWKNSDIVKIINPREAGRYCHFVVRKANNGVINISEGNAAVSEYLAERTVLNE